MGITPDLILANPVDPELINNSYGKKLIANVIVKRPLPIKRLGAYQKILFKKRIPRIDTYDLVIDTSGIYVPFSRQPKNHYIYVYNPLAHRITNAKYRKGFWRLYWAPYERIMRSAPYRYQNVEMLAVSQFTKDRIKEQWGLDSQVLYPPVAIDDFVNYGYENRQGVITIGRFTPEKRHDRQLEIARELPDVHFRICGSAETPSNKVVFKEIQRRSEEMGLRNVTFHLNIKLQELRQLIYSSRHFLHTMENEDFGLTVCEAIAGGCIPLVHDSGGPKEIVPFQSLRFTSIDEAVSKLRSNDANFPMEDIRNALFTRIQSFSEEVFKRRLKEIMSPYLASSSALKPR